MATSPNILTKLLHDDLDLVIQNSDGKFTPAQVFASKTLASKLFSKFEDISLESADRFAENLFLKNNERVGNWTLQTVDEHEEIMIGTFRSKLYDFFHPTTLDDQGLFCDSFVRGSQDLFDSASCGPGNSIGASGNDFYTKLFSSRLTASSEEIHSLYAETIATCPIWSDGEKTRQTIYGAVEIEGASHIAFAPKNVNTSRVIAVEPSLNTFFQLGFGGMIAKRLDRFYGINIKSQQPVNRELARIGSIDGSIATIDLSSASDSISLGLVEEFIPKDVKVILDLLRTPNIQLSTGETLELNMVSTMGNGFTFPLMTAIFCCVVSTVLAMAGVTRSRALGSNNCAVFGDDIIIPVAYASEVIHLLTILGFQLNRAKCFLTGPFRESCGADWYEGQPVRSVYIHSLKTMDSRIAAINGLNLWTADTGIPLPNIVQGLFKTINFSDPLKDSNILSQESILSARNIFVPCFESMGSGIHAPLSVAVPSYSFKHRELGMNLLSYKVLVAKSDKLEVTLDDAGIGHIKSPKGLKQRMYNSNGLYVSLLQGCFAESGISIRSGKSKLCWQTAFTPNWESCASDSIDLNRTTVKTMTAHAERYASVEETAFGKAVVANLFS